MIITTAPKATDEMKARADRACTALSAPYVERGRFSIASLQRRWNCPVLVAEAGRLVLHTHGKESLFYHPNVAMIRAKQYIRTGSDPMVKAAGLKKGMSFADMTLGLGSDALVASLAVGNSGKVFGTEVNPVLCHIVKEGFRTFKTGNDTVTQAMRRIHTTCSDHLDWLRNMPNSSVDVVFFDPMFKEEVKGSDGLSPLKQLAASSQFEPFLQNAVAEARRVARKAVILKDHFRSGRFQEGGFTVEVRPSATYHFGVWKKQDRAIMD
ncbi:class I SAM-dependent methyltransferase [Alteribacter lacisalsi]|nr:class I SAM-dependent methyltransferase [Alteribacter lacisalsi]